MYPQIFLWKILLKIQVILQNAIEEERLKSASSHLTSDWLIIGCISLFYPLHLLERAFLCACWLGFIYLLGHCKTRMQLLLAIGIPQYSFLSITVKGEVIHVAQVD